MCLLQQAFLCPSDTIRSLRQAAYQEIDEDGSGSVTLGGKMEL